MTIPETPPEKVLLMAELSRRGIVVFGNDKMADLRKMLREAIAEEESSTFPNQ